MVVFKKKGTKATYFGDDLFCHNTMALLLLTALISVDKYNIVKNKILSSIFGIELVPKMNGFSQ